METILISKKQKWVRILSQEKKNLHEIENTQK